MVSAVVWNLSALNRKLLRDLWHIRGQVLAIAAVVAAGIAMYVMSAGALNSLEEMRGAYYDRYRFADLFATAKRAPDRLKSEIAALPGVAAAETRLTTTAVLDIPGVPEPASAQVVSLPDRGGPAINNLLIVRGRYPASGHTDEALILQTLADANGFRPGDDLKATIHGHRRVLKITGVAMAPEFLYSIAPGALAPDDRRYGVLWLRRDALAAALDMEGAFNSVVVALTRDADAESLKQRLDTLLEPYGGAGAHGRDEQQSDVYLVAEIDGLKGMATVLPAVFLGVAVFLMHVVVQRLLELEREQIGLLKAFGYSNGAVGWHYAKLILSVVLLGLIAGNLIGTWFARGLTEMYGQFFRFPIMILQLEPQVYAAASLIALGTGALGLIGGVRKAVALRPAAAMAPPAPEAYSKTMIDRLGLARMTTTGAGMVLRHMVRRPARVLLTWFGLSLAVGLNIGATFMMDSLDRMIDVQFNRLDRQHAFVSFTEQMERRAFYDFLALPGVLAAEPVRHVAAELRFGHREKRIPVTGLPQGSQLGRIADEDETIVDMPSRGIALTASLAERLQVGPGDRIIVDFREGNRHTVEVPVATIGASYIGMGAYMDLDRLNRLSGDGHVISGVRLAVDDAARYELYDRLKVMPTVQGVTLRETMLQAIDDTITENFLIMTLSSAFFAALIAVGVVYNTARITLSERGRELASTRVLGFTRAEVSVVLLGELAVVTLAAMPLGCLLGLGLGWLTVTAGYENELLTIPLVIQPATYGLGMLVLLGGALLSAWIVKRRVDKLDMVAVLKTRE